MYLPNKELLRNNKKFHEAWNQFINQDILEKELIREVIANSWLRCKSRNIDPYTSEIKVQLNEDELNIRRKKNGVLLSIARPFMEGLYKIVENTDLIVRLTDSDGYIIDWMGDIKLVEEYGNLSFYKGCNVKEEIIGTNAMGTALLTGNPIQVLGSEHYCKQYHNWTCSACPVKDENGNIIGILGMTGDSNKVHPHTLGMVVSSAEAIENGIKVNSKNKQLRMANRHLYAIMESISEGLICIDRKGIVTDINYFARKMLKLEEEDILGNSIKDLLDKHNREKILKLVKNGRKSEEQELYLKTKTGKKVLCIVNITPINDVSVNQIEGIVITFKEAKVVHNLVNKIIGAEARFSFNDIIGKSQKMKNAIRLSKMSAKTDTTILLLGESGTGKEMFAQSIHNMSNRRNKPFVFLNCGAIPRELVASELFGYVEGAFTGAKRGGHPGKFELADGGTIFLDEIGDMPLDTQSNLLRVLETKEIVRIGGHDVIPVDVRVIAATHKNLEKEVQLGNFRQDLFYRLNVMPIKTPSLKERREDISLLIDNFINKFSNKMNKKVKGVSDSFYRVLQRYDWPGNVRELQNVIQLVINMIDDDDYLTHNNLPDYIKNKNSNIKIESKNELVTLEEIEKEFIKRTLEYYNGNISLTSKSLGIGRSTLYRKIEKYSL